MDGEPRRRWWRKKRWWAALVVWLLVFVPASAGPTLYGCLRGWIPHGVYNYVFRPIDIALDGTPADDPWARYILWWAELAFRHRGDDVASE